MADKVVFKTDNRYKDGNLKRVKGVWRGNAKTTKVTRLEPPKWLTGSEAMYSAYEEHLRLQLNPPILVTPELATVIKPTPKP